MMFMSLAIHCTNISSVLSWMLILRQEDLMTVSPEIYPFSCLSNQSKVKVTVVPEKYKSKLCSRSAS